MDSQADRKSEIKHDLPEKTDSWGIGGGHFESRSARDAMVIKNRGLGQCLPGVALDVVGSSESTSPCKTNWRS